jgi:hypothetical protein
MEIPIPHSLSNAVKIALKMNEMFSVKEARITWLGNELLGDGIIIPSLWNGHEHVILKRSLGKCLSVIHLARFEIQQGGKTENLRTVLQ